MGLFSLGDASWVVSDDVVVFKFLLDAVAGLFGIVSAPFLTGTSSNQQREGSKAIMDVFFSSRVSWRKGFPCTVRLVKLGHIVK